MRMRAIGKLEIKVGEKVSGTIHSLISFFSLYLRHNAFPSAPGLPALRRTHPAPTREVVRLLLTRHLGPPSTASRFWGRQINFPKSRTLHTIPPRPEI